MRAQGRPRAFLAGFGMPCMPLEDEVVRERRVSASVLMFLPHDNRWMMADQNRAVRFWSASSAHLYVIKQLHGVQCYYL